jgi:hypothetical protein
MAAGLCRPRRRDPRPPGLVAAAPARAAPSASAARPGRRAISRPAAGPERRPA